MHFQAYLVKFSALCLLFCAIGARPYHQIELRLTNSVINLQELDPHLRGSLDAAIVVDQIRSGVMKRTRDYSLVDLQTLVEGIDEYEHDLPSPPSRIGEEENPDPSHRIAHQLARKIKGWRDSYRGFFVIGASVFFFNTAWASSFPQVPYQVPIAGGLLVSACMVTFDMIPRSIEYCERKLNPPVRYLLLPVTLSRNGEVLAAHVKISLTYIMQKLVIDPTGAVP